MQLAVSALEHMLSLQICQHLAMNALTSADAAMEDQCLATRFHNNARRKKKLLILFHLPWKMELKNEILK